MDCKRNPVLTNNDLVLDDVLRPCDLVDGRRRGTRILLHRRDRERSRDSDIEIKPTTTNLLRKMHGLFT